VAKGIYTRIYADIQQRIAITRHALLQAQERDIGDAEHIEDIIRTGRVERFGKNYAKFISRDGTTCVAEITSTAIIVITVERGNTL